MLTMACLKFLICVSLLLLNVLGQDCIDYGHRCAETGQCCGGCCIEGECIDTYRACYSLSDLCRDHYCPPEMSCTLFKPEDCPGCEQQPICQ